MASPSFQIISDLHLETQSSYDFSFKQTAPNLALLGDVGQVADTGFFPFLQKQLERGYWNVVLVLGNHEPHGTTWQIAKSRVREFEMRMAKLRQSSTIAKFVFLDQGRWDVNESLTILGCTLFSNILEDQAIEVGKRVKDFRNIRDWTVDMHVAEHRADLQWMNNQVSHISKTEPHRKIAIFIHYSSTLDKRAVEPKHIDSPVSSGFVTDLRQEMCGASDKVVFWAFGHTHHNCDFVSERGMRVIANQRGYASANVANFDPGKVYVVGAGNNSGLLA